MKKHCNYSFYGQPSTPKSVVQEAIHAEKTKTTCPTFGNWWVDRGQIKYDEFNGHYSSPQAAYQHYYETPYFLCNSSPNDHEKMINWDNQNLNQSLYNQEKTFCSKQMYHQDKFAGGWRDRNQYPLYTDFVPFNYNLSETQMLAPTIYSTNETEHWPYIGGGNYTVDKKNRTALKKDYYMSTLNGFPTEKSADYAAKNLMMPMGISVVHYL